ncbi:MAG TPA: choice-of-anchor A family protein [Chthonomonadaceae bacterium]|nr:choice-of-anchor A family protein [Chthonomonadaceae bacterium]
MKRTILSLFLSGVTLMISAGFAQADDLGVANNYNVFVLGNDIQSNNTAQGKVAIGGNGIFSSGTGGSNVNYAHPGSTANALIIMGDYISNRVGTYGSVDGTVYVGGNATIDNPKISGSLYVNGNTKLQGGGTIHGSIHLVTGKTYTHTQSYAPFNSPLFSSTPYTLPVNFGAAGTYLTNHATGWGSLAANGATSVPVGGTTITLTHGNNLPNNTPDIFFIDGDTLAANTGINIFARNNATVLINISKRTDGSDALPNTLITLHGTTQNHVLFNFFDANTVSLNNSGITGSVLAPYAAVDFGQGRIEGTLVAGSLTGSGEALDFPFAGFLPSVSVLVSTTPEPGLFALLGAGCLGSALLLRRRRRRE